MAAIFAKAQAPTVVAQRSSRRAVVVRAAAAPQDMVSVRLLDSEQPGRRIVRDKMICFVVQGRRAALGALAGAAALVSGAAPSFAEFGESANVFGKVTNKSGFSTYAGEGFSVQLPAKWNPSREKDFPGVQLRWVIKWIGLCCASY
jgi:hypothetical protein